MALKIEISSATKGVFVGEEFMKKLKEINNKLWAAMTPAKGAKRYSKKLAYEGALNFVVSFCGTNKISKERTLADLSKLFDAVEKRQMALEAMKQNPN